MYATANKLQSNFARKKLNRSTSKFAFPMYSVGTRDFSFDSIPLDRYRNGRSSSRSSVEYPLHKRPGFLFFYWKHISP